MTILSRRISRKLYVIIGIFMWSCHQEPQPYYINKTIKVTATAYNSFSWQAEGDPTLTYFGDTLKPGMKAVAISRDLLDSGITHNTPLLISGLPGIYYVKDLMHGRWRKRIDIYMGKNLDSARQWGRQKVRISWITDTIEKPQP